MEIARQILSVLLVFSLLGVLLWALRRGRIPSLRAFLANGDGVALPRGEPAALRGGFHPSRVVGRFLSQSPTRTKSLRAVERLTLTPHHSLHLIELHGCELLISTHSQGCTLLSESVSAGSSPAEASPVESPLERLKQASA